ncbi:hypothetical protein [Desulfosporosinus sp. BG]|uniref:hypothetical protein n=1 Tax=Desulfosporosinus sp. BG TaxID=1633135 RepID=UPI00083A7236|nr:hypothetical protein [Desulfosporosinus sp. BG]ODA39262.1 Ni2+-binding GTPase involved in regulation of expression and maturation of hydrogenase [Desulfosporosinus sp. BG]
MKLVAVSGPPSSGRTSIILKAIEYLKQESYKIGVIKFDCLTTFDNILYEKVDVPVKVGPTHILVHYNPSDEEAKTLLVQIQPTKQ